MADVFEMDAAKLFEVGAAMDKIGQSSVKTAADMQQVQEALTMLADAKQKLQTGEFTIIDPDTVVGMQRVEESMKRAGVNLGIINKQQKEWNKYGEKNLLNFDSLTNKEKRYIKLQKEKLENESKYVRYGNDVIKLGNRKEINENKLVSAFKKQGQQLWNMAKSMAGVDITLVGIIALLIEAYNITTKVAAMSQQTAAAWGGGNSNISKASGNIWRLHTMFRKTVDEAGAFTASLARSGLQADDVATGVKSVLNQQKFLNAQAYIAERGVTKQTKGYADILEGARKISVQKKYELGLSDLIMASEIKFGTSAAENVKNIKALANNFGLAKIDAYGMLGTVRESAIELGKAGTAISIEEVTADWSELIDKTKSYNTDLLGTLALYNTLINKDVAKKLGLGDAPMVVRREIAKTIAGFSNELEDGWKAALGEGASAAARILNFEDLLPEDQFVRMANFINKHIGGSTEQAQYRARMLLKQLGFASTEARKFMAKSFVGGKFTVQGLEEVKKAIKEQREAAAKLQEKEKNNRQKLIDSAASISVGLQTVQDWIKQNVIDKAVAVIKDLITAINDLSDLIPDMFLSTEQREKREHKRLHKGLEAEAEVGRMFSESALEVNMPGLKKYLKTQTVPEEFIKQLAQTLPGRQAQYEAVRLGQARTPETAAGMDILAATEVMEAATQRARGDPALQAQLDKAITLLRKSNFDAAAKLIVDTINGNIRKENVAGKTQAKNRKRSTVVLTQGAE